jgi:hypothetical protein
MAAPIRVMKLPGHDSSDWGRYLHAISGGERVLTRTRCDTCGIEASYQLRNSKTGGEEDLGGDAEVVQAALHALLDAEQGVCFTLTFSATGSDEPARFVVPRLQLPVFRVGQ